MSNPKGSTSKRPEKVRADDAHLFMKMYPALWLDDPEIVDPSTGQRGITLEQEAAYLRLCLAQFRDPRGILTPRKLLLAAVVGCELEDYSQIIGPVLERFFDEVPGGWSHDTVRSLWVEAHAKTLAARDAAGRRWRKHRETKGEHALANTNADANASCKRERERERERESPQASPGGKGVQPEPPKAIEDQTDQQSVIAVWVELMGPVATKGANGRWSGGMVPSRIVQSVLPLVKTHGRAEVLKTWWKYLSRREPQFASPEDFCQRYVAWATDRGTKPVPL
jgi:uncharacterized protein YdaU (DUF1376 family)